MAVFAGHVVPIREIVSGEQILMVRFGERPSRGHDQHFPAAGAPAHGAEHRPSALVGSAKKIGFVFIAPASASAASKLQGPRPNYQNQPNLVVCCLLGGRLGLELVALLSGTAPGGFASSRSARDGTATISQPPAWTLP